MKKLIVLAFLTSCGSSSFTASTDPLVDFADYLGKRANTVRDYMANCNFTSEDVGKGTMDTKDDTGSEVNRVQDYFHARRLYSIRHGDQYSGKGATNSSFQVRMA